MRHRHWFLVAALLPLGFAFFMHTTMFYTYLLINFQSTDLVVSVALSIACVVVWTILEIAFQFLDARRLVCRCGYSLRGVKCPECGKELG